MASIGVRFLALSALVLGWAAPLAAQTGDDEAIHAMVRAQEAAFNTHDASAYARFLEPDADMVTSLGWWLKGRDAYTRKLGEAFQGKLGSARVHAGEMTIRMLGADLALVHITWTLTGTRMNGEAIESQILRRTGSGWLIASSQETEITPEKAAKPGKEAEAPTMMPQPTRKCLLGRPNGDCLIYK